CRWSTALFRGDVATSIDVSAEGIQRYDRARHGWMGPVFGGHDPGVCARSTQALSLTMRGRYAEAARHIEAALSLAEELKHPNSQAHALMNAMVVAQIGSDHPAVDRYGQQLLALADKYNLPPVRAHTSFVSGWARAFAADLDA